LQKIISEPEERKKLIIYINPPYAEAGSKTSTENKGGVAVKHKVSQEYRKELGKASNELFALFLMRIKKEICGCKIGEFSKFKVVTGSNFNIFRQNFQAKFMGGFCVLGSTFDNVIGNFPIGFKCWDTAINKPISDITVDVIHSKVDVKASRKKFDFREGYLKPDTRLIHKKIVLLSEEEIAEKNFL